MSGTQQNWNSVWQEGPHDNHTIGAAALRAPAASKEDSRPHAILKFQPRNSFDYSVHYEPQLKKREDSSYIIFFRQIYQALNTILNIHA